MMRVAIVHSFYRSSVLSGENIVVQREFEALQAAGHEVMLLGRHTDDEMALPAHAARAAVRVATRRGPDPSERLRKFAPDVVHVHNLFPNIGYQWLAQWPGALVTTMHNFRPLCAAATLFRDGHTCTLCPDGDAWAGVRHSCYGSPLATLPLAMANCTGVAGNALLQRADRVIALSDRVARVWAGYGLDADKIRVVPNGYDLPKRGVQDKNALNNEHDDNQNHSHATRLDDGRQMSAMLTNQGVTAAEYLPAQDADAGACWLVIGRVVPEKGLAELAAIWPSQIPLDVLGDGPQRQELEPLAPPSWRWHGQVDADSVATLVGRAAGVIVASVCMENFPTTITEAFAQGVPVVAREGNSGADFVAATGSGVVFSDAATLANALREVTGNRSHYRAQALATYRQQLCQAAWVDNLISVFTEAIAARGMVS